jgi:PKD repeat protein
MRATHASRFEGLAGGAGRNAMLRTRTRLRLAVLAALLAAAAGCTLSDQSLPSFTGPSELALSLTVTASPDTLTRDGASQSLITVQARGDKSQAVANVSLRADIACLDYADQPGLYYADYGALSAKTAVTGGDGRATFVYTAPSQAGPLSGLCQPSQVWLYFTPVGQDYNNAVPRQISLRLIDPGILLPPSNMVPAFTYTPSAPIDNDTVAFDASTSTGSIASFAWTFGDGGSSTGVNATHKYTRAGTYNVTLTVADAAGRTASKTQTLNVGAGAGPVADFDYSPAAPKSSTTVYFNASKSKAAAGRTIVSYDWDFGSGRTGTGVMTEKIWDTPATYRVTLVVTDDAGRTGVTSKDVTVTSSVVAKFTYSPTSPRAAVTLVNFNAAESESPVGIVTYAWDFGDGTAPVTTAVATTTHTFATAGSFIVRLTITDGSGRTASTSVQITVVP